MVQRGDEEEAAAERLGRERQQGGGMRDGGGTRDAWIVDGTGDVHGDEEEEEEEQVVLA